MLVSRSEIYVNKLCLYLKDHEYLFPSISASHIPFGSSKTKSEKWPLLVTSYKWSYNPSLGVQSPSENGNGI